MNKKEIRCGATGEKCNQKQNKDGSYPCDTCPIGIAFRKQWENIGSRNLKITTVIFFYFCLKKFKMNAKIQDKFKINSR